MLAMLVFPVGLGWLAQARSKSQKAWENVEAIRSAGMSTISNSRSANPRWQRMLGIDLPEEPEECDICLYEPDEQAQAQVLTRLRVFPHLKKLSLGHASRSAAALDPLTHFAELQDLRLRYGSSEGLADGLAVIAKIPHLTRFSNDLWEDIPKLENLLSMTSLEELTLDQVPCNVDFSKLKNLRRLHISHDFLDSASSSSCDVELLQIATLGNLEDLKIESAPFTDAGLKPLTQLKKLKSLSLESDLITDAGLATLAEMPSLVQLELTRTQVTDEAIADWKQKRPGLTITKK